MAKLFKHFADVAARWTIAAIVIVPVCAWAGVHAVSGSPLVTQQGVALDQPIPFSHAHHVGEEGLDCRFCHTGVETARLAPAPSLHVCMTCHSQIWKDASVLAALRTSAARNRPIEWARVHRLPDYVYFDHSVHIANGVGCSECHGDVAHMPLTVQAAPMTMQWCLDCHRDPGSRLRPAIDIFDTSPRRPNPPGVGAMLMQFYAIHKNGLTECSTCHR
jgi:hypothetical protein